MKPLLQIGRFGQTYKAKCDLRSKKHTGKLIYKIMSQQQGTKDSAPKKKESLKR